MKPHICFIAGTKGGVGKSFAACQLVAAAEDLGLSVGVFDSDSENSTLKNLLKDKVEFLDDAKEDYPLDKVISAVFQPAPKDIYVVDMKAGTSRSTMDWFSAIPWKELNAKAEVCVICSITVDPDATRTVAPWLIYFNALHFPTDFVLIKNEKDGRNFETYNTFFSKSIASFKNCIISEITFPAMDKNYITILNNAKISLKAAISTDRTATPLCSIMAQSRLNNYYHAYADSFISLLKAWLPESERTETQKEVIANAEQRIQLRKELAK